MSEWMEFEGRVIPLEWGDNIYTILPLPDDIAAILRTQNTKRVALEINDHVLNLALTKAPPIDATAPYSIGETPGDAICTIDQACRYVAGWWSLAIGFVISHSNPLTFHPK